MEKANYKSYITGEVSALLEIKIASTQTIQEGDLLECVATSGVFESGEFSKVVSALDDNNCYCVATSDIETKAEALVSSGYFAGFFSEDIVLETSCISDKLILAKQGIHLTRNRGK